jgi:tetratricopeptide (TPR) repeat protein
MKENTYDIELIEKFLDGKMTVEEKLLFEEKQAQNEEFKNLLTDMDLLLEGVKLSASKTSKEDKLERLKFFNDILDMEAHLSASEDKAEEAKVGKTKMIPFYQKPWVLAVAASVALLITVSAIWMQTRSPQHERLYAIYFQPFDSPGSGLTRGSSEETLKTKAYDAYDNGRYDEAITLFNQILQNVDDPISHLCLGNAQLEAGQFAPAEKTFNHMLAEHSDLVTQAKWYLALTYLKQAKMERAKATLWEISKSSTYGEKANKLLKELD